MPIICKYIQKQYNMEKFVCQPFCKCLRDSFDLLYDFKYAASICSRVGTEGEVAATPLCPSSMHLEGKVRISSGVMMRYWDDNGNSGHITFNLKDNGIVAYNDIYFKTAEGAQSGWGGTLTLSANCSVGLLEGSGLNLHTRDLVTFNSLNNNAGYGSKEALLANYINGGSITLNGEELTYSATGFDSASLNAEDVGKYTFILTDNAIRLQYVAYSQAATVPETPAIPEPTTATLSLLALCGLAARRRRK